MINTKTLKKDENAQNWYKQNNITNVPTMIVSYKNKPIFVYSGTNKTAYKYLLNNKDPKTHKKLQLDETIYQNDFTHSREELN